MTPFDRAIEFVLRFEGGHSDDPRDPGGETKFGISQRAYPALDIDALTRDEAIAIYRKDYWNACKCGQLPPPLALATFDAAVNQGVSAATRMLQEALGVKVDGIIGPVTIAAAGHANIKEILPKLFAARCQRYAINPNVETFGKGWFRRAAACLMTALEPL